MAKQASSVQKLTTKQWTVGTLFAVSLLGNVAAITAFAVLNNRTANVWITNQMVERNCVRDLDYNLAQIDSEAGRALYGVAVCGGLNYKTKTYLSDDIKAMVDKVNASKIN